MRTLSEVAKRLMWWKNVEEVFQDESRLIAQIMVFGDLEDTMAMLRQYTRKKLKQVLDDPPPGVFTPQAWTFWHLYLGENFRPLPQRFIKTAYNDDTVKNQSKIQTNV
ncbi:MAG: hypothetical protein K9K64_03570 [Desulfohalobiaceae bacterium]|nr:hypothetical protein [Desulfohalobiaceae bacterium]